MARVDDIMTLLQSQLKIVLPSFQQTRGSNSGNPTLLFTADATPATTEDNAFIQLTQKSYSGFPTVSLASSVDGRPDVLQIALEKSATATISVWTTMNLAKMLHEAMAMNVEVEIYLEDNGTVPSLTSIDPAKLAGRVLADARHPNVGM